MLNLPLIRREFQRIMERRQGTINLALSNDGKRRPALGEASLLPLTTQNQIDCSAGLKRTWQGQTPPGPQTHLQPLHAAPEEREKRGVGVNGRLPL